MLDQTTRRDFLLGTVAGNCRVQSRLNVAWSRNGGCYPQAKTSRPQHENKPAHRRRRVIYNNDGDDIWARGPIRSRGFSRSRHDPLLKMQVDSIFYCTTQSFNLFTHETSVAEEFLPRARCFVCQQQPPDFSRTQADRWFADVLRRSQAAAQRRVDVVPANERYPRRLDTAVRFAMEERRPSSRDVCVGDDAVLR